MRKIYTVILLFSFVITRAQNIAINGDGSTADPSAALHIKSTNRGLLIPSMTSAQRTSIATPANGLLVYQTDSPQGFYYNSGTTASPVWTYLNPGMFNTAADFNSNGSFYVTDANSTLTSTGKSWLAGGNNFGTSGAAYKFGTISSDHIDYTTSNLVRGRMNNLGQFFWGGTSQVLAGEQMNSVSSATFPWALNGYSGFNGGGVYGDITGLNTTTFAAIQGENNSVGNFNSAAIRGINASMIAGTGFRTLAGSGPRMGVNGYFNQAGSYSFGVYGSSPSFSQRTGALFGDDGGIAMGSVGYFASDLNDYSFYGFGNPDNISTGVAGGRILPVGQTANTHIGMGLYGGVMGAWIRGQVYGTLVKGERYSLYVDGQTYTNKPITQIIETADGQRLPTYTPTSTKTDVTSRGKSVLESGGKYIAFDAAFKQMISDNPDEITITVTPNGNSNGVYVSSYDTNGFWVKENNNGTSTVNFTWIAISTRKGFENPQNTPELLETGFDQRMNGLMHNEMDTKTPPTYMWWDGTRVRYDAPPQKKPDLNVFSGLRNTQTQVQTQTKN